MKRRITVALSEAIVERLEDAAERPGSSKAAVVEASLQRFLGAEPETVDDTTLLRRLNGMSRQLEQLDRDLSIVGEMGALHVRYHLSITTLPQAHQRTACAPGPGRLKAFAAQVGRRLHLGTPLTREKMDRLGATKPDPSARDVEEAASPRTRCVPADSSQDAAAPTVLDGGLESSAGVGEGASAGDFRGEAHNPYR